jgi:NAD(P)-dependent dehydrogenase (short-subunit alcohol dehydrogenase family)
MLSRLLASKILKYILSTIFSVQLTMSSFDAESTSYEVAAALSGQIKGKTVLITGCSPSSLGLATALAVASQNPGLVILAGRSESNVIEAEKQLKSEIPGVNTRLLIFDLADLGSVRRAAAEVNSYEETLDVLINNAGVMVCPYEKTVDGFETQLATNHLGPFLFTNLLLSKSIKVSGLRIVNVTSGAYQMNGIDWETPNPEGESYSKFVAYAQTKAANILFAVSLAKKLGAKGILAFSADPGSKSYSIIVSQIGG